MLPDAPAPSSYWSQDDPRSMAAHKGVIAQMVLDFQPSTEFMKLNMHNIKSIDHTTMIAHTMSFMSSLKGYEHSS